MSEAISAVGDDIDTLTQSLVDACMEHALVGGRLDYKRVSVAMIDILADIISRQREVVRNKMLGEFEGVLRVTVADRALKHETIVGLNGSAVQ